MPRAAALFALLSFAGCVKHREIPLSARIFDAKRGWVDLIPGSRLRLENAYFRPGEANISNYVGTETAHFLVAGRRGMEFERLEPALPQRPTDQTPTADLIPAGYRNYRFYRYYFAIVFTQQGRPASAALLAADSEAELNGLSARLATDPDGVCAPGSKACLVFSPRVTAAVEVEVTVNGTPRRLLGTTRISSLAPDALRIEVTRRGSPPLILTPSMTAWFNATLFPGDDVRF